MEKSVTTKKKKAFSIKEEKMILKLWHEMEKDSPEAKRAQKAIEKRSRKIQQVFIKAYGDNISEQTHNRINKGLGTLAMAGYLK